VCFNLEIVLKGHFPRLNHQRWRHTIN